LRKSFREKQKQNSVIGKMSTNLNWTRWLRKRSENKKPIKTKKAERNTRKIIETNKIKRLVQSQESRWNCPIEKD
jgi:hypothetical protein